jgi:hypothetical protein
MELLEPIIVLRRQTLYPTELRARGISTIVSCACRQLQDRLGFGFGSIGSNCDHFCWKLETQTRFFGDFLSEFHVMPDFIVQVRHAFASPPRPKIDNAGWRGRVVLQVGVAESTEGSSSALLRHLPYRSLQRRADGKTLGIPIFPCYSILLTSGDAAGARESHRHNGRKCQGSTRVVTPVARCLCDV